MSAIKVDCSSAEASKLDRQGPLLYFGSDFRQVDFVVL
jgi:uncharacterized protein with PIN domain